jgi:hypothetical protein
MVQFKNVFEVIREKKVKSTSLFTKKSQQRSVLVGASTWFAKVIRF